MDYKLVRRRGQKYLKIHFDDSGTLIVSCPYYTTKTQINDFLNANSQWISDQQSKQAKHSFSTADELFLWGKPYSLVIYQASKDSLQILENLMLVYVKDTDTDYVKKTVRKYYKQVLENFVQNRIGYWCDRLSLEKPELKINAATSKWGSCIKGRNLIWISLMTATLDERLADMIVLHELCHLIYANHQDEFWSLMEKFMPDLKERKRELSRVSKLNYHRNLF